MKTTANFVPKQLANFVPKQLVGLYFLVPKKPTDDREGGRFEYQGQVVGQVLPDVFIVQYYEWFIGTAHSMKLAHLEDMTNWEFWADAEDWRNRCAGKF